MDLAEKRYFKKLKAYFNGFSPQNNISHKLISQKFKTMKVRQDKLQYFTIFVG